MSRIVVEINPGLRAKVGKGRKNKQSEQCKESDIDGDIETIKAYVKYCTDKEQRREYMRDQTKKLEEAIPRLKEQIAASNKLKSETDHKMVTVEVNVMNELEALEKEEHQTVAEIESLKQLIEDNREKVKRHRDNKKKIDKLNEELNLLKDNHNRNSSHLEQTIAEHKKNKLFNKAEIVAKKQELEHIYLVNSQKKAIDEMKSNKQQFISYQEQLKVIKSTNERERDENLENATKFIRDKSEREFSQFSQKVHDDIETVNRKLNQCESVQDFKALLRIANIPILEFGLDGQQQEMLNIYLKHYEILNTPKIEKHTQSQVSLEELSHIESDVQSHDRSIDLQLKEKESEVNLMEGKYADILMKLMTLTDRSSAT